MSPEYRNIYQIPREAAGLTQERAAELIGVSVESVRAYESGRRVPPDETVVKMIEIYNAQYLAYQHLKTSAAVGQQYLPDVKFKDLPSAILNVLNDLSEFVKCRDDMIAITCDGKIDANEQPRWDTILDKLDKLVGAALCVKFVKPGKED